MLISPTMQEKYCAGHHLSPHCNKQLKDDIGVRIKNYSHQFLVFNLVEFCGRVYILYSTTVSITCYGTCARKFANKKKKIQVDQHDFIIDQR